ncbi:MAG TPA: PilZ domain-containing protein [Allosphingosinicella sp.]|nr:PilZ domain-containing protein [Allosphingosinicella sp.]
MIHARIEADAQSDPRRREPRIEVAADVALREFGSTGVEARLINLSSHGFMAETRAAATVGARVWLTLSGGTRVSALVKWAKSGRLGGEFAAPIDPLQAFQAIGTARAAGRG